jgi:hypothetical protein
MKQLRDYQIDNSQKAVDILNKLGYVYLAMQVRTGKTATALETSRLFGANRVLFLTKKKAITSIHEDYTDFGFTFDLVVTNHESIHKVEGKFDVVILDEWHKAGSFPKPGLLARTTKAMFGDTPMIALSGTPSPESFSQLFHQFWVSNRSPWRMYSNFYKWCKDYVDVRQKKINGREMNDYTRGIEQKIMADVDKYMVRYTQASAGFKAVIDDEILSVRMSDRTYSLADKLMKDLIIEGKEDVILADTPVKLMQKLMQIYSGTVKLESGKAVVLDKTKAEFIRDRFKHQKIGIFYVFKEEFNLLKLVLGDSLTTDLDEFNSTDKSIALQIVSGREAISLRNAQYLVMFNIQHSAVSYIQSRDRMTTIDRLSNKVYWLFSEGGIEEKIYKVVSKKLPYTSKHFKKDYILTN